MKPVNINDVAQYAGVSKKTVSRVINSEANVSAAMREKVQKAIDELGFKPSLLGLALANNRSFSIALLSENSNSEYLMKLQKGILQGCTENQMGLFLYDCTYRSPTLLEDVSKIINASHVDGFILAPPICDQADVLKLLEDKQIPYIRVSPKDEANGEFVGFNATKAAFDMANYLLALNHKHIAFVKGHEDHESSHRCERGFQKALAEAGLTIPDSYIFQGDYSYQSGIDAYNYLMTLPVRPTAIFASNDEMALGVLYQAQKSGMNVPNDVSICGIDDMSTASKIWPNLTTMHHPIVDIGYLSASLLIKRLQKKAKDYPMGGLPSSNIIDCKIVVRQSVRAFT